MNSAAPSSAASAPFGQSQVGQSLATPRMRSLSTLAREKLMEHGFDPGHDLTHCHRVAMWCLRLDASLDVDEVVAASLLHDVVNLPKTHPDRALASKHSADFARSVLPSLAFDPAQIERIAGAVESHSYSAGIKPTTSLGRALQDADRLETLGAIGIMRVFSTGCRMGAAYFQEQDPWATARELNDRRYSVDHFKTKLFRLPSQMCTEAGRVEAEKRVARMRRFLADLASELAIDAPDW